MERRKYSLLTRRKFLYTTVAGALSSGYYARFVEPYRLSITHKEIKIPHLPTALDGILIAHLTDFHYQPAIHEELLTQVVQLTNQTKPDIIALTGDYINNNDNVLPPLLEHLAQLKAKHGMYAIQGNHDAWYGRTNQFRQRFTKAGFDFLLNQGTSISLQGEQLFIAGAKSAMVSKVDSKLCFKGHTKETLITLIHEPDVFDKITSKKRIDLQLSGHTHGGQCRVPIIGYAPAKIDLGKKYIYGEHSIKDSRLFVSRGIGTTGVNVRFACAPEIALLRLRSSKG